MDVLLRHVTHMELAQVLTRHAGRSSAPHLVDPEARQRARRTARRNGVWERIGRNLDPAREIPVFKHSVYRHFRRTGNRTRHQAAERARAAELDLAVLALWLDHPKGDPDYLQDLLWAYCDDWTWVMAAHERTSVDLGAAATGTRLAEAVYALGDRIEPEVADRVHAEVERRILRNMGDYRNTDFWHTARMNWNHVCNGCCIRTALLEIRDPHRLARFLHPAILDMTYALDGFADDGGCWEGTGYWGYGFGHFVHAAVALHDRTGGELDLMAGEKIARIARFPLATHIEGAHRANFADCKPGSVSVLTALQINRFLDLPALYELCPRRDSGAPTGAGPLQVNDLHALALYRGEKATGRPDPADYLLPDLGMVKLRSRPGREQVTVVANAGHNGVPHSHNDVGSFQVFRRGRMVLVDPGSPEYNRSTFSERRYEILFCRSRGHSVPVVNGREQKAGAVHRGTLSVEGLNGSGRKRVRIDMTRAYPRGIVQRLVRTLDLDPEANTLAVEDAYRFRRAPREVEEAFVTFEPATVVRGGAAVRIGPVRRGMTLEAGQPGRFRVEVLAEETEAARPGGPPLVRIGFVPSQLTTAFSLRFVLR